MDGRVLIVDDDSGIRDILKQRLIRLGLKTREAGNGREALERLQGESFDTILCDIQMPEMNGLELVEYLGKINSTTPVIMLTGLIDLETAVDVMKKGAFDYLTKPIHSEALIMAVQKAVQYKRVVERNELLEEEKRRYQAELERRVKDQTRIIRAMFELANRLNSLDSMKLVLDSILSTISEFIPCKCISIMLLDHQADYFTLSKGKGMPYDEHNAPRIPAEHVAWRELFDRGSVRVVREWGELAPDADAFGLERYVTLPAIMAPLQGPRSRLGMIHVWERENGCSFSPEEAEILSYISDSATVAIDNQLFEKRLEDSYLATIKALAKAIEAKDPYTRGHSERVAELCARMAQHMGLEPNEVRTLRFAGILHDVGKIGISEQILTKPGRLTPEEFDHIRRHPTIGEAMVQEVVFLKAAREIIRQHHERIDGTGYPDGLVGDRICMGARIMAVADAYDAMTTNRTYRRAMEQEDVLLELIQASGTQFDSECVRALVHVVGAFHEKALSHVREHKEGAIPSGKPELSDVFSDSHVPG